LYADNFDKYPTSWSSDGKFIIYSSPGTSRSDLWILPLTNDRKPFAFTQTTVNATYEFFSNGQFSPDGQWIAYQTNTSQREIYVAPFPGPGGKRLISTQLGSQPRWRRDGKEIYYVAADHRLMVADVKAQGAILEVGAVRQLFGPLLTGGGFQYDVSADGQRFLAVTLPNQTTSEPLTLIQNWVSVLKK